jgi:hypothetical protein
LSFTGPFVNNLQWLGGQMTLIAKGKNPDTSGVDKAILEGDPRWKIAERVARSAALYRASQLRDMLLFIVRQSILNPDEPIHEFEIAYRVLGRRSDFNPLDDNIVRVQMAHLRKKLELYFTTDGKQEDTVITVALGSYRPIFSPRDKPSEPRFPSNGEGSHQEAPADSEDGQLSRRVVESQEPALESKRALRAGRMPWTAFSAAVLILCLTAGCAALWVQNRRQQRSLDAILRQISPWKYQSALSPLWSSVLDSSRDTDVVVSDDSFLLIEELNKQQTSFYGYLGRSYINSPQSKSLNPDLQFVEELLATKSLGNTGEFKLAHRILDLDPLNSRVHLYSARQYLPSLVKQDNVILIGGQISNPFAELFEGQLNFIENTKFDGFGVTTVTNRAPVSGEAAIYTSSDAVGYCVVAYLPNPGHDGKVLLLEGTSSEATEAAGDFLLSENQFGTFRGMLHSTQLPFFEVLLKTSQVRGTPLTATVEAYRIYPDQSQRAK